jgi:hypothetical protein
VGTTIFAGHEIEGGTAVETVTENEHAEDLSARSKALHCTNVVPEGNVAPDVTLHVRLSIPDVSVALKVQLNGALPPLTGGIVAERGQDTKGGASSVTTRRNEQEPCLLALSVAVQVTGVYLVVPFTAVPTVVKFVMFAGLQTTDLIPDASDAVVVMFTIAPKPEFVN